MEAVSLLPSTQVTVGMETKKKKHCSCELGVATGDRLDADVTAGFGVRPE